MKFLIELAASVALFVAIFGLVIGITFFASDGQKPKDASTKRAWRIM